MGKRERYEPGTFCWADLATTDPDGAKAFYGGLFGWEAVDEPFGEGGVYTKFRLGGDEVSALYELEPVRREQGVPSHWSSYVSVQDAAAVAARAEELGAVTYGGAFDVGREGRMAIVQDSEGAVVYAWEPGEHIGAGRINDPGCMTWNELHTRAPERAAAFYAELFGWEMQPQEDEGRLAYVIIQNSGRSNGGIMPVPEQGDDEPPYWASYFTVSSCDAAAASARELGGTILAGPMDLGAGRIAFFSDPQGAAFAVFEGETDD